MAINLHSPDHAALREAMNALDANKPSYDNATDMYYGIPSDVFAALDERQRGVLERELRRQQEQKQHKPQTPTRLSHVEVSHADVGDPESAMALPLSALVALWRSRWGDGWVQVPLLLQERFWAVGTKRLYVLNQFETYPYEGDPEVVRLKDPDANY